MPTSHHPKRSLGQNFLVDPNFQRKIVDAAKVGYAGQTVMEIGPGRGAITKHLREFAGDLVLVEKDRDLAAQLTATFTEARVFSGDFMEWNLDELPDGGGTIVVANLPYNVSTQILIKLLKNMRKFAALILMFQKEVASRCVSVPGSKEFGILSVWCRLLAEPKKLFDVPPNAFRPRPNIVSSVVKFTPSATLYDAEQEAFMDFVKLIFSQRRKKIGGLIKSKLGCSADAFSPELRVLLDKRAEALTLDEMKSLCAACVGIGTAHRSMEK